MSFSTLYTQISFFFWYNLFNVLVISMLSISLNEKFELKNQILIDDTYQFCFFSNDLLTRYQNIYILFSHLPFPSQASRSNVEFYITTFWWQRLTKHNKCFIILNLMYFFKYSLIYLTIVTLSSFFIQNHYWQLHTKRNNYRTARILLRKLVSKLSYDFK